MERKQKISLTVFIIGIIALIVGAIVLFLRLNSAPSMVDAEFLVEIGRWEREDAPSVVWEFSEIGKGTLTTNSHINDYEFIWAIEDDKLKIETNWLYDLEDEYSFKLDQNNKTLTLTDEESGDINFRPASSVDAEITESN